MNCRSHSGFTLVELVAVVALLTLLGSLTLVGYRRSATTANYETVVRDLSDIDLAKSVWAQANPDSSFPTDATNQWLAIAPYLPYAVQAPSGSVTVGSQVYLLLQNSTNDYTPDGYAYSVGALNTPSAAVYHNQPVIRPTE